jgi:sortase A
MRASRTRQVFSYLLLAGGALLLYWGGRDVVESRLGQDEAKRQFEAHESQPSPASRPSPFGTTPRAAAPYAPPERPVRVGDTIARLEIPRLGADLYIVEGDGARQLRLGPGHIAGTALPGQDGNCIIAGHRDTHFRVLKDIRAGDEILLQTARGEFKYRVDATKVVSPRDTQPLRPTRDAELHLVTCYPFYYLGSAPKRFIVRAELESPVIAAATTSAQPASPENRRNLP